MRLFIGLMSGTSMDGVDAALVDLGTNALIAGVTYPYSSRVRQMLDDVMTDTRVSLKVYSQLNTLIGRDFASAAHAVMATQGIKATDIRAIGSHGQTICHDATADIPYTLQLGCAHTIAELTGLLVVADFRTRDLVIGGQGAPFAPIYHQEIFKDLGCPLAIINIGGIANLTFLQDSETVRGFDLGPGNCLMDSWIAKHFAKKYDEDGTWAATGQIIAPLLQSLQADPFFQRRAPKSIGKEYFSLTWLQKHLQPSYSNVDIQATLLMFTASCIANGVLAESLQPKQLLICGGGAHNKHLISVIANLLPTINVASTATQDIHPDFLEAAMMAWLAEKNLSSIPLNLSKITGSSGRAILGSVYPPGINMRKM